MFPNIELKLQFDSTGGTVEYGFAIIEICGALTSVHVTLPKLICKVFVLVEVKATGVGLTVYFIVVGVPTQPFKDGVIITVEVIGLFVLLVAVKAGKIPVPEAAKPIAVLLFVQEYVVPDGVPDKMTPDEVAPAQSI